MRTVIDTLIIGNMTPAFGMCSINLQGISWLFLVYFYRLLHKIKLEANAAMQAKILTLTF